MEKYLYDQDAHIERKEHDGLPAYAELWDCDGNMLMVFPGDMSDDQIMVAVAFANKAYGAGIRIGELRKIREIKAVLAI